MKVITFGCRINSYESALIQQLGQGVDDHVVVINSCAVTAEAERQCKQKIRSIKKQNPNAFIVLTGCAAQLDPDAYEQMPEVDRVLGNHEKIMPDCLLGTQKRMVADIAAYDLDIPLVTDFEGKSRAYVQVQQGCDHACTFCIVTAVRGKNKGVPIHRVVDQVRQLVQKGYTEIVLTGIDVTSYPYGFSSLVERVLADVPELKRLRLGSLDPADVDDPLIALFGREKRLMPHMHLSIQAGDDLVLKRMGRRHTRERVLTLCKRLRAARPDVVFGADFITGFPTETDDMFDQTLDLVKRANIILLHVFPFSVRPSTPSAKMPMVPMSIRKERAKKLRNLGDDLLQKYLQTQIGKTDEVLVEKPGLGMNTHYIPTRVDSKISVGDIVRATNQKVERNELVATV